MPDPVPVSRSLTYAVLSVALFGAGALAGCDRQGSAPAQQEASAPAKPQAGVVDRSQRGKPLPAFTLSDPQGQTLALAQQTGRPLLINLWATWCAPCVAELPTLEKLAQAGKVRVLTVSQDMSDPAKVTQFLAERGGPSLEPWLDPANDLSFHYGTGTLPTTIYYDAQGREVWRFVGEQDWSGEEAAKLLAEAAG